MKQTKVVKTTNEQHYEDGTPQEVVDRYVANGWEVHHKVGMRTVLTNPAVPDTFVKVWRETL